MILKVFGDFDPILEGNIFISIVIENYQIDRDRENCSRFRQEIEVWYRELLAATWGFNIIVTSGECVG